MRRVPGPASGGTLWGPRPRINFPAHVGIHEAAPFFEGPWPLDAVAAQVDSMAGVTTQLRQQFVYGTAGTAAATTTLTCE